MTKKQAFLKMLRRKYECFKYGHRFRLIECNRVNVLEKKNKNPIRLMEGLKECEHCGKREIIYCELNGH
jgi:hypothetical protein